MYLEYTIRGQRTVTSITVHIVSYLIPLFHRQSYVNRPTRPGIRVELVQLGLEDVEDGCIRPAGHPPSLGAFPVSLPAAIGSARIHTSKGD